MSFGFNILLLIIAFVTGGIAEAQEIYKTTSASVEFFSSAPLEDIRATSQEGISVFKPATGEISFRVYIRTLKFNKAKMQEHFNEEFMESDRYPTASFNGKIIRPNNLPVEGEVPVLLGGILEVHGVSQKREIPAVLQIEKDKIRLKSHFNVACEDHNIKIPRILWKNIAEVVRVDVNANYKN